MEFIYHYFHQDVMNSNSHYVTGIAVVIYAYTEASWVT
jgi:hypothetical protein